MRHYRKILCLVALAAAFLSGCRTTSPETGPLDTTKYTIESTDKFVPLDEAMQTAVSCTGLQERILPDGRLEVVANIRNRVTRRLKIQANCVFKDEHGFSTGDETPFRTLNLDQNMTEAVTFTSASKVARRYTIRVRETR